MRLTIGLEYSVPEGPDGAFGDGAGLGLAVTVGAVGGSVSPYLAACA